MPDLGKYAVEVALSYGATLVLLGGLVLVSARAAKASKARLDEAEARLKDG